MSNYVPPEGPTDARIVLVGEAPGGTENQMRRPFVGKSGRLLDALLRSAGIERSEVYLTNLVKYQPRGNSIRQYFRYPGVPNEEGALHMDDFWKEMRTLSPNVIVTLGAYPTAALLGESFSIGQVRGHVEGSNVELATRVGCKVIPTFHPAACLREKEEAIGADGQSAFALSYLIRFDLCKAAREADTPWNTRPDRLLSFPTTADECVWELEQIAESATQVAFDFETDPNVAYARPWLLSFAPTIDRSVVIPLATNGDFKAVFTPAESHEVARGIERIMRNPDIAKVAQNAMFDIGVLAQVFGIRVRNLWMDTMLAHATLFPSLAQGVAEQRKEGRAGQKDLEFLSSLYTSEPLYKKGRTDMRTMNALDSAITLEIAQVLDRELQAEPARYADYRRQAALIEPLLACSVKGVGWDPEAQVQLQHDLTAQYAEDEIAARVMVNDVFVLAQIDPVDWVMHKLCKVKYKSAKYGTPEFWAKCAKLRAKKPEGVFAQTVVDGAMPEVQRLALMACVNPNSTQQLQHVLYVVGGIPAKTNKDKITGKQVITTDGDALRAIVREESAKHNARGAGGKLARRVLELRRIKKALGTYANIVIGEDGRFRCAYNVARAYTARLSSRKWFNQGTNGQNFPREARAGVNVRNLLIADPGKVFLEPDLEQAEDRYVAWDSDDRVMMELYRSGGDPYKLIATWWTGKAVEDINKDERYISKRAKLAYNYGIGPITLSAAFAKDGFDVDVATCKKLLKHIAAHSPASERRKSGIDQRLKLKQNLVTPFGRATRFMDRVDESMFRQGYAHGPQSTIAEITNTVLRRIYDEVLPEEPQVDLLMQQHDGILMQVPLFDVERIIARILPLYDIPIKLSGGTLTIPVSFQVGVRWGEMWEVPHVMA